MGTSSCRAGLGALGQGPGTGGIHASWVQSPSPLQLLGHLLSLRRAKLWSVYGLRWARGKALSQLSTPVCPTMASRYLPAPIWGEDDVGSEDLGSSLLAGGLSFPMVEWVLYTKAPAQIP